MTQAFSAAAFLCWLHSCWGILGGCPTGSKSSPLLSHLEVLRTTGDALLPWGRG